MPVDQRQGQVRARFSRTRCELQLELIPPAAVRGTEPIDIHSGVLCDCGSRLLAGLPSLSRERQKAKMMLIERVLAKYVVDPCAALWF
jgi:hypothetical protein